MQTTEKRRLSRPGAPDKANGQIQINDAKALKLALMAEALALDTSASSYARGVLEGLSPSGRAAAYMAWQREELSRAGIDLAAPGTGDSAPTGGDPSQDSPTDNPTSPAAAAPTVAGSSMDAEDMA